MVKRKERTRPLKFLSHNVTCKPDNCIMSCVLDTLFLSVQNCTKSFSESECNLTSHEICIQNVQKLTQSYLNPLDPQMHSSQLIFRILSHLLFWFVLHFELVDILGSYLFSRPCWYSNLIVKIIRDKSVVIKK